MRVLMYLRISSEDADMREKNKSESNSIAHQRWLLTDFVQNHPDLCDAELDELCDDGWSGKNFERPGVIELLEQVKQGRVMGRLSGDRFSRLSATYEKEQAELEGTVKELRGIVSSAEQESVNVQSFLTVVKKYTEPTELTPMLLREFVEKIVVHEADKSSGHRVQRIDVHYSFIGEIEFSPEYSRFVQRDRRITPERHAPVR